MVVEKRVSSAAHWAVVALNEPSLSEPEKVVTGDDSLSVPATESYCLRLQWTSTPVLVSHRSPLSMMSKANVAWLTRTSR